MLNKKRMIKLMERITELLEDIGSPISKIAPDKMLSYPAGRLNPR